MQPILSELTTLSNSENAKVALRARQVRAAVGGGVGEYTGGILGFRPGLWGGPEGWGVGW